MYLFGGNTKSNDSNDKIYCLNIGSSMWEIIKVNDSKKPSRDEHTAEVSGDKMYIFGGFENGIRKNSVIIYDFQTKTWEDPIECGNKGPAPRAGHSSCVYNGKIYIFGGKDEDNEKLKDLWSFDMETRAWTQYQSPQDSFLSRSGHTACVFNH